MSANYDTLSMFGTNGVDFKVLKGQSSTFDCNCFAYVVGQLDDNVFWDPNGLGNVDDIYSHYGFHRVYPKGEIDGSKGPEPFPYDSDFLVHKPYLQIAVVMGRWTGKDYSIDHHCLRVEDGWHSKLGYGPLIWHKELKTMCENKQYGRPLLIYHKKLNNS